MSDVFNSRFEQLLHGKIKKAIEAETENVGNDLARDFADYRHRTGKIAGLTAALELFDAVREELFGKDQKDTRSK